MTFPDIEKHFRELSEDEQVALLHRLQQIVTPSDDVLPTPAQRAELERRLRAVDSGEMATYPLKDVLNYVDNLQK